MTSFLVPALRVASIASALIAAWLVFVVVAVLPGRDPDRIPMWTAIAVAMLGLAALSWFATRSRPPSGSLRVVLGLGSIGAAVVGAWILAQALQRTADFEGYLVVIGIDLVAHGLLGATYSATRQRGFADPSARP